MPELNWIGKSQVVNHVEEVPFRLLRKEPGSSEGVADSGNMILHGDNLEALKGLLPYYRSRVKLVFIDPQKSVFEYPGKLNNQEADFATDLDGLDNILCWYRNADKGEFALQGHRRPRFNPDFIAFTKSGKTAVLEWKGTNLASNEDTRYKEALGNDWAALDPENRYFRVVGEADHHEILREIANL